MILALPAWESDNARHPTMNEIYLELQSFCFVIPILLQRLDSNQ